MYFAIPYLGKNRHSHTWQPKSWVVTRGDSSSGVSRRLTRGGPYEVDSKLQLQSKFFLSLNVAFYLSPSISSRDVVHPLLRKTFFEPSESPRVKRIQRKGDILRKVLMPRLFGIVTHFISHRWPDDHRSDASGGNIRSHVRNRLFPATRQIPRPPVGGVSDSCAKVNLERSATKTIPLISVLGRNTTQMLTCYCVGCRMVTIKLTSILITELLNYFIFAKNK